MTICSKDRVQRKYHKIFSRSFPIEFEVPPALSRLLYSPVYLFLYVRPGVVGPYSHDSSHSSLTDVIPSVSERRFSNRRPPWLLPAIFQSPTSDIFATHQCLTHNLLQNSTIHLRYLSKRESPPAPPWVLQSKPLSECYPSLPVSSLWRNYQGAITAGLS